MNGPETSASTYRVLRQLGERVDPTHAAVRGAHDLVVLQQFARSSKKKKSNAGAVPDDAIDTIARVARGIARNWHPNVARVRHIDQDDDYLSVATEIIDGLTLVEVFELAKARRAKDAKGPLIAPPMLLRIVLDVLGGLQNIHGLRDEANASLKAFHGAVCPQNIVVGKDGVARLVASFRPRPVRITKKSEALRYSGPEALEETGEADRSNDLYACGVILWEGLQGRALFSNSLSPSEILHHQREDEIAWAVGGGDADGTTARLGPIVIKALEFDPALRFRTAAELATALRRIAGPDVATGSAIAQRVMELGGDRIRSRRAELDQKAGRDTSKASSNYVAARSLVPLAPVLAAKHAEAPAPATRRQRGVDDDNSEVATPKAVSSGRLQIETPNALKPIPIPTPPKSDPSLPKLLVTSPMVVRGAKAKPAPEPAPAAPAPAPAAPAPAPAPAPAKLEPTPTPKPPPPVPKAAPPVVVVAVAPTPPTPPPPPPIDTPTPMSTSLDMAVSTEDDDTPINAVKTTPFLKRGMPLRSAVALVLATFFVTLFVILIVARHRTETRGDLTAATTSTVATPRRQATITNAGLGTSDRTNDTPPPPVTEEEGDASTTTTTTTTANGAGAWMGQGTATPAPFDPAAVVPAPTTTSAAGSSASQPQVKKTPYEPLGI